MEQEMIRYTRKHFSKLGLMYVLGSLIITAGQIISTLIVRFLQPALLDNYNYVTLIQMLPMYAVTMPLMALLIRTVPAGRPIMQKKMRISHWFLAFFMCYGATYLSNLLGNILTQLIGAIKGDPVENAILGAMQGLNPILSIVIVGILAPVMEEFLFRKLLIDRTIAYGEGTSVVFSGLIFGLFHGNLNQFAYAFVIGMFFGFLYVKTGKLRYTILMHMAINNISNISMILLKAAGLDKLISSGSYEPEQIIPIMMDHMLPVCLFVCHILLILGIALTGLILWIVFSKKFSLLPGEIVVPKGKRFSAYICNVGMILFCLFWIVQIIWQLFS